MNFLQESNFERRAFTKQKREHEVYKNLEKIVKPLENGYFGNKEANNIYWKTNDIIKIKDTKERAAAIDNLKKEVDNFLKNNKQTYFNY
jgi:exonuclease VII small subunit